MTVSRSSLVPTRDEVVPDEVKPNMRTAVLGGGNGGTADGGDCLKLMNPSAVLCKYNTSTALSIPQPRVIMHQGRWSYTAVGLLVY